MGQLISYLKDRANIILEPPDYEYFKDSKLYCIPENDLAEYSRTTDLVITLGGDGTILHTSSLFPAKVPPFVSFSLGSLGFLTPFGNHS